MTIDKMTLEQAITELEPKFGIPGYCDYQNFIAWETIKAHLASREVSDEMLERASWASCLRCCEGDEDAAREEWTKYADNYWEDAKVMLTAALKEAGK